MTCSHPGCNQPRATAGVQLNGNPILRKKCLPHYKQELVEKKGFTDYSEYQYYSNLKLANKNGYSSHAEYKNSTHPYRYAKLTYCENVDSRLGFRCTTTISLTAQLDVDHIDGCPDNNDLDNLQTLCKCCHTYKTIMNKDYKTPGRKTLGVKY